MNISIILEFLTFDEYLSCRYTHAPSVSLCLSILSLHNDSEEAPNFLLSECEAVIRIMKPKIVGIPNNEVSHNNRKST